MNESERKAKARGKWLKIYEKLQSISKTSRKCGISRATLYRWINRYKSDGLIGLSDKSKRPKTLANLKVDASMENFILDCRTKRNWGPQRISTFIKRKQKIEISPMTVWRVLSKHQVKPILKRRKKADFKRYSKSTPGDRVQLDVTKIKRKAYQFTAIDDCTRLKVIRIYPNKKAESAIHFLGEVLDSFSFPIQHIQTDWGTEFFNYAFQNELHEHFIKYRPIKPKSPHLNGKVERTQQTDKIEFWDVIDVPNDVAKLNEMAIGWQNFFNQKRPHSSLNGKTPWQKYLETENEIPIQPEITQLFWESDEQILPRNSAFLRYLKNRKVDRLKLETSKTTKGYEKKQLKLL
jgi:transposase InsO family protein